MNNAEKIAAQIIKMHKDHADSDVTDLLESRANICDLGKIRELIAPHVSSNETNAASVAVAWIDDQTGDAPSAIIATFPAYTITAPIEGHEYKSGDKIAMPFESARYGTMWNFFQLGTIAGTAIQEGRDPAEAVAECERKKIEFPHMGHKQAWAFGLGVSITSEARERFKRPGHKAGDLIQLDGKTYRIKPAANRNIELQEV